MFVRIFVDYFFFLLNSLPDRQLLVLKTLAKLHSSVDSVADLRTGDRVQRIHSSARIYEYKMGKDEWFPTRLSGRMSDYKSDSIFLYSSSGFRPIYLYCNTKYRAGIQSLMIYASQSQNRIINGAGKMKRDNSNSSAIYPTLHNRYIAYVYPKYFGFNGWNFCGELSALTCENCFCLLLTVCYLMLSVWLNFVAQSVWHDRQTDDILESW